MCRILGITNFNYNKHKDLINGFFKIAETGNVPPGNSSGHYDGWGVGYYKDSKAFLHKKGSSVLRSREDIVKLLKDAGNSKTLMFHLRKSAWPKTNTKQNAHPFKHKNILFAHNGTVFDYKDLNPAQRKNMLDSEAYSMYVTSFIQSDIKSGFKRAVKGIKKTRKHSSLTCLFSDGKKLYAYREYTKNPDYYTLYHSKHLGSDIICSEPASEKLKWKMLSKDNLFVY